MGRMSLLSMLEETDLDTALSWHLKSNHYPPLPDCVKKLAKEAIDKANEGEWDAKISLEGTGISWRGQKEVPVSACIEGWHLHDFLNNDEE